MRVRPGSLRPFFPDEFTSCLGGCDAQLLEMLGVNKLNRQQGPGATPAGGARGGGGRFDPGPGRGGRGGRGDPGGPGGGGGPGRGGGAVRARPTANVQPRVRGRGRGITSRDNDSGYQSSSVE